MKEKAKNCTSNEENALKVIQEFEELIKNKKSDIVWLAHYQGKIFQSFNSFMTEAVIL